VGDVESLINMTVRRRDDVAKVYGTVVLEDDFKARIKWGDGTITWESKRDLLVLD
jgi:hypothetical protein